MNPTGHPQAGCLKPPRRSLFEALGAQLDLIQKGLEANYALWDRAVVNLDGLLQTRIDGLARKKHLVEAFSARLRKP